MEEHNPWWFGEEHPKYVEWKAYQIHWVPRIIDEFYSEPFALNFLVGPRQVGKTMSIMLFIHLRLIGKLKPQAIFYLPCDEVSDYRELGEIIDTYLSARREWGIRSSYIILDEITYVEEWWRAIKSRIDRNVFKNDIILISGSVSIEVLKERERFPGRRGNGKDIVMYPLDFSEFVRILTGIAVKQGEFENIESWKKAMQANIIFSNKLIEYFRVYLKTGGFPIPIREYFERGNVTISSIKVYLDWLKNDWAKLGKSDKYMKEIIGVIIKLRLNPISWLHIANETSVNSPNTIRSYIETLEDMLVAKVLHIYDPVGRRVYYRKNKKVHIIDPFMYRVLAHYARTEVYEEQVVESTVLGHVMRMCDVYYWRNRTEVDIIGVLENRYIGFEVKWGPKKWRKPRHLKDIFLLKEKEVPLFLASIKWEKPSRSYHKI